MKELDFVLGYDQLEKIRKEISQKRRELNELEVKINQEERALFKAAGQSGLFRISLGEFVKEYKKILNKRRASTGRQKADNILLVDSLLCLDAYGNRVTDIDHLTWIRKMILDVNIVVDSSTVLSLEDIELKLTDKLADGTLVKDALKDNGCANMLMFKNEALLMDVIVDFSPDASAMKRDSDVRNTVLAIVSQKAANEHEHFKD